MNYQIEEKVLQATLNYLATKPFAEVYQLIAALQAAKKFEDKAETKAE